jgi:hypothetical protein
MNDSDCAADVRAMEERRRVAMLAADTHALRDLLDEGLIYVHSTGGRDTRASYLQKLDDGVMRYESLALDVSEVQARERFALLRGAMSAQVKTANGTIAVASHYEAIWMQAGGAWRLAAFQSFLRDKASGSV